MTRVLDLGCRDLDRAGVLPLSSAALELMRQRASIVIASAVIAEHGELLGALQLRGEDPLAPRRTTTGRSARLRGTTLLHLIALPSVSALAADGTRDNLLNRNVRGWLRGYSRLGLRAAYFGRDVLHLDRRPVGLLGYDIQADGGALIELLVGVEAPVFDDPGAAALQELFAELPPVTEMVATIHQVLGETWQAELEPASAPETDPPASEHAAPTGAGYAKVEIPLGAVHAFVSERQVRVYGDMLCSTAALRELERTCARHLQAGGELEPERLAVTDLALQGARHEDVWRALKTALVALRC